jgi:pimeloyl-ACP methyl ester carboxylesterase
VKVRLGDIDVGYTVAGEGPPVVLIHGLAEDRASWAGVQAALPGYRSYACDLRGHGETTLGAADGTLAQLGGDLVRFLTVVSGPAACVGYSLGGTVVLWTAAEHQPLVRHAIVAGTSSVVGRKAAEFFAERISSVQQDFSGFAGELRRDTAAQLIAASGELDAVTGRRLAAIGDGTGYVNAARAMQRLADEPLEPLLRRISCPVDVIAGEKDVFCPRKAAELLMRSLAAAEYHEIAGAGHLMSIDNPAAYADFIKRSLDRRLAA